MASEQSKREAFIEKYEYKDLSRLGKEDDPMKRSMHTVAWNLKHNLRPAEGLLKITLRVAKDNGWDNQIKEIEALQRELKGIPDNANTSYDQIIADLAAEPAAQYSQPVTNDELNQIIGDLAQHTLDPVPLNSGPSQAADASAPSPPNDLTADDYNAILDDLSEATGPSESDSAQSHVSASDYDQIIDDIANEIRTENAASPANSAAQQPTPAQPANKWADIKYSDLRNDVNEIAPPSYVTPGLHAEQKHMPEKESKTARFKQLFQRNKAAAGAKKEYKKLKKDLEKGGCTVSSFNKKDNSFHFKDEHGVTYSVDLKHPANPSFKDGRGKPIGGYEQFAENKENYPQPHNNRP